MKEIWKPIQNFEGLYEVSNLGNVRSLNRIIETSTGPRRYLGQTIYPESIKDKGYLQVTLAKAGKNTRRKIHQLVLEAFVGSRPPGYDGCHNDGNMFNNVVTNLRWDTKSNNQYDYRRHLVEGLRENAKASIRRM